MFDRVAWQYRSGRVQLNEFLYALDIAKILKLPLDVFVEFCETAAGGVYPDQEGLKKEIERRIRLQLGAATIVRKETNFLFTAAQKDCNAIFVSNDIAAWTLERNLLVPFGEREVCARGAGEILIPFGNGDSSQWAVRYGVPFARLFRLPVVFWHTTWRNDAIAGNIPHEHMCESAERVRQFAENLCGHERVRYRTIIETNDDVMEGISRFSIAEHCALIVMSSGKKTGKGKYGLRLIGRPSPVPILIVGRG